ncbi:MAG: class I SAM-dependent methyltransferase [Candidatus Paceibacterota bacterium]|jgi:SAM-dependent methyltransferase
MNRDEIVQYAGNNIQGWMSFTDLEVLWDLVHQYVKPGGHAIEVGCWKGESTYVIGNACKNIGATLYAIDTWAGNVEPGHEYKNKADNVGTYIEAVKNPGFIGIFLANVAGLPVLHLQGDSQKVHEQIPDFTCDFCFLDGDHNSPVIDNDIKNYLKKIRPGGIICGHDHGNPEGDVHWAVERAFGTDWKLQVRPLDVPLVCTTIWVHEVK